MDERIVLLRRPYRYDATLEIVLCKFNQDFVTWYYRIEDVVYFWGPDTAEGLSLALEDFIERGNM